MQLKVVKILLLATLAGICSCESCTLPTTEDLEDVIADIIEADDSSSTPTVNVMSFHPVCLAFDDVQDRYRAVSVLVEYRCTGNPSCPSGTVVEQIESECSNGVWSNTVQGSPEFTRSPTPEANFSTSTRQDCAFCVSPELVKEAPLSLSPDNVTHCVACDSSCSEGLMGCTGTGPNECCNYYNNSMCVDECPNPFQPNTANECVCPPGTTGLNCTEDVDCGDLDDPENGEVSFSNTTYNSTASYSCDPGYNLTGNNERTCLVTGVWSGNDPTCTIIDCGSLADPQDGKVSLSTTTYRSTATYSCDSGYRLTGNNMTTCQANGVWSGSPPRCTKCAVSECSVCDTDTDKCDACSKEGAKFDPAESKCIVGDDGDDDDGGLSPGAIAGIVIAILLVLAIITTLIFIGAIVYYKHNIKRNSKVTSVK